MPQRPFKGHPKAFSQAAPKSCHAACRAPSCAAPKGSQAAPKGSQAKKPRSQETKKVLRQQAWEATKTKKPRSQKAPKIISKGMFDGFSNDFRTKANFNDWPQNFNDSALFFNDCFFPFFGQKPCVFTVKSRISMIIFTFFFNDYFNDYFLLFLGFRGRNFNFFQNIDAFFKKRWSSARSGHEGISGAVVRALGALICARGAWAEAFCSWTSMRLWHVDCQMPFKDL